MRCARHALPGIEWDKVEEAHGRALFELPLHDEQLHFGVTEANITNADPQLEIEDDAEEAREDAGNPVGGEDQNDIIILD